MNPKPAAALRSLSDLLAKMERQRVIPVIRNDADQTRRDVDRFAACGLNVVELTTSIPGWADVLAQVISAHPGLTVGVGTITDPEDGERACRSGAAFLVSPYPAEPVRAVADRAGVPFIGGGLSPGEVAASARHGAAKLFPAHVGGPAYLRTLRAILPEARIMPTGGISLDAVPTWLAAGAFAVGIGNDLATVQDLEGQLARLREQPA